MRADLEDGVGDPYCPYVRSVSTVCGSIRVSWTGSILGAQQTEGSGSSPTYSGVLQARVFPYPVAQSLPCLLTLAVLDMQSLYDDLRGRLQGRR